MVSTENTTSFNDKQITKLLVNEDSDDSDDFNDNFMTELNELKVRTFPPKINFENPSNESNDNFSDHINLESNSKLFVLIF